MEGLYRGAFSGLKMLISFSVNIDGCSSVEGPFKEAERQLRRQRECVTTRGVGKGMCRPL